MTAPSKAQGASEGSPVPKQTGKANVDTLRYVAPPASTMNEADKLSE